MSTAWPDSRRVLYQVGLCLVTRSRLLLVIRTRSANEAVLRPPNAGLVPRSPPAIFGTGVERSFVSLAASWGRGADATYDPLPPHRPRAATSRSSASRRARFRHRAEQKRELLRLGW